MYPFWNAAFFATLITALPLLVDSATSDGLIVRKEWRSLTTVEKSSYIDAVKCMLRKPPLTSKSVLPGVQNRFEDFLGDHIQQANLTHFVREIRACGFDGGQPYWDWSLDANSTEDFLNSEMWDPDTGFGGNGAYIAGTQDDPAPGVPVTAASFPFNLSDHTGGGCIPDGPFANMTIHMGPGPSTEFNEWCVRRDFVPSQFLLSANSTSVAAAMDQPDFGWFSQQSEMTTHNAGHVGIGGVYGVLTDVWASPGDPLFFLHHANIDRLWWSWQSKNLSTRLTDISGPVVPQDWSNKSGGNVTLDFEVHVGAAGNLTRRIRDLMDIRQPTLGYVYESLY
ncbi:hypothetical protein B0J12DRAFT_714999 [Macrophomina phaseolina]|uniref:Tyrosinase copper-binding domain-containing protein n=1 Tax=Macrophomina phaseolina TaxID=35725 RepID=A0ABQ8FQ07_9PEZI|nr:hypothetical protein B0J12DRAFT_714999 [Macrophomina phaseolina]